MTDTSLRPRRLWWLAAGFGVWGSALILLYGLHAIGCAFGWPTGVLKLSMAALLAIHGAGLAWMVIRLRSGDDAGRLASGFLQAVFLWSVYAALAATFLTFVPPLFLTACV